MGITAETQIKETLRELAAPPAAKIQLQTYMLRSGLLDTEDATGRFVELAKRMLASIDPESDQPIEFPTNMLGDLRVTSENDFDLSKLYPDFPEFTETDTVELQSQLAHSRREIQHLQREIDQLHSELGQAHEIFEQIHKHPIAGPIVRIRQKLVGWMARFKGAAASDKQSTRASNDTQPIQPVSPEPESLT